MEKKKIKNKSDLGDDFVAPDGGWGWLVCIAGGLSNLFILQLLQSFGLLFHERLLNVIGLTNPEITTIINTQNALSAFTGLLNGPMFRRFSYRQVSLVGSLFVIIGAIASAFANSFATYILAYSIIYGFGMGICISSTSLALNTYFKERRRRANSYAWTISGIGPIIMPPIITVLLPFYGFQGTLLLFSGLAMNAIPCALIYQPVQWHVTKNEIEEAELTANQANNISENNLCENCRAKQMNTGHKSFSLQEGDNCIDSTTPMLTKANDGWYGSKYSLNSLGKPSDIINRKISTTSVGRNTKISPDILMNIEDWNCTCTGIENQITNVLSEKHLKWYEKVVIFFDLDLLNDFTYVNLMLGLTLSTFVEINFAMLTPFFLQDFGFSKSQTAFAMSSLGCSDIIIRFLIPIIMKNIKWDNRVIYSCGLIIMVIGRIAMTQRPTFTVLLVLFIIIGFGKAIRTIFMGLVIPSHVPLKRFPAAAGLQLVSAGIFTLIAGPIIGIIRDKTSYAALINFLNVITVITATSWTVEVFYNSHKRRSEQPVKLTN